MVRDKLGFSHCDLAINLSFWVSPVYEIVDGVTWYQITVYNHEVAVITCTVRFSHILKFHDKFKVSTRSLVFLKLVKLYRWRVALVPSKRFVTTQFESENPDFVRSRIDEVNNYFRNIVRYEEIYQNAEILAFFIGMSTECTLAHSRKASSVLIQNRTGR